MASRPPPVFDRRLKHLIRVQILSPLSFLVSLGALAIGMFIARPCISDISARHWTYIAPRDSLLLIYWAAIYFAQIGFALYITLSTSSVRAQTLISAGVGLRLAFANLMLAIWVPLWLLNTHATSIASTVLLGLAALGLLSSVLYIQVRRSDPVIRPTIKHRPFEWICVHLPLKLFLVVLFHVDVWQQLFMAVGFDYGEGKRALNKSVWPTFAVVTSTSALASMWIFATTDFAWFAAAVYLYISILFNSGPAPSKSDSIPDGVLPPPTGSNNGPDTSSPPSPPPPSKALDRPPEIFAALVLAIALLTTSYVTSIAWTRLGGRREGQIALPSEEQEAAAAATAAAGDADGNTARRSKSVALRSSHTEAEAAQDDEDERRRLLVAQESTPAQLEQSDIVNEDVNVTRRLGSASGS
ncbi:hypothetical protein K437DRAFT_275969 [Tilletiaria anomala UBC 951]|uniref:Uncharacterized protein n=1 Tax=Tilletiaria anomala (strain ATCC 24038 / CBS 436.72 / UBC 951) TaxID=1037660 RepID=A0A066VH34_TILAU|nr:uncharacterized protein K437DRAFT_275969 [Tilletiaria anomala UBC 951]KDN39623.1 hypothetical protein K437DRAFT_275969 [Tilletiaria anomala UBC 951]